MPDTDRTPAPADPDPPESQRRLLESISRRVQGLTVAVVLMALILFLLTAADFGKIVEYHAFEPALVASTAVGTAVLGFLVGLGVGLLVRRK